MGGWGVEIAQRGFALDHLIFESLDFVFPEIYPYNYYQNQITYEPPEIC
jgi:hypothetical protein